MNVEKTMEFILQQQAKAEGQMAALRTIVRAGMKMIAKQGEQIRQLGIGQRQGKEEMAELRRETAERQREFAEHRREFVEHRREFVEHRREFAQHRQELRTELKELARAHKVTEVKLQALIDTMRRGSNGRHSRN
jgi:uncharacterized coiled-coil DUF342 family protein